MITVTASKTLYRLASFCLKPYRTLQNTSRTKGAIYKKNVRTYENI